MIKEQNNWLPFNAYLFISEFFKQTKSSLTQKLCKILMNKLSDEKAWGIWIIHDQVERREATNYLNARRKRET